MLLNAVGAQQATMCNSSRTSAQTALAFARALDRDDFDEAMSHLALLCVYHSPNGKIVGAVDVIASYRHNAEWARATFDNIEFESEVEQVDAHGYRITYIDRTTHQGQSHEYRERSTNHILNSIPPGGDHAAGGAACRIERSTGRGSLRRGGRVG